MVHHRIWKCEHDIIVQQCRCPSPKKMVCIVPCEQIADHDMLLQQTGAR